MIRSGFCGEQLQRGLAVRRLEDLVALRAEAHAQQLADRRLVVDHQDFERSSGHAAVSSVPVVPGSGSVIVKTAPARSVRLRGRDRAVHGLDEAAGDREPKPGAGAHVVALLDAVELVEDVLEIVRRNARRLRRGPAGRRNPCRASL